MVPVCCLSARDGRVYGTLRIDKSIQKKVSPVKYGFHYEEIGMMGEGALNAELVRNRCLEEANPPAGIAVKDGLYQDVPFPKGKNKAVYEIDPLVGWMTFPVTYSPVRISLTAENPLNNANRHSLLVETTRDISGFDDAKVVNVGYYGMNFKKGLGYDLSFFVRNRDYSSDLTVFLTDASGRRISEEYKISVSGDMWEKHSLTLIPLEDVQRGLLAFRPVSSGMFQMDVVSMRPRDTWDNGKSVFRADIMENLKEYSPDFIRFPGGCIVHGINEETMYKWKKTIGPAENRPGQWSKWSPNYRTDGIGYHEFYELCEYLGADAMYVISTGMICTGWVWQASPWNFRQPEVNLDWYIQDALDAIEYAIGGTDTRWGALRAANGHPDPFPLKYVEIGNEDFGPVYWERYEKIYQALHSKYPDLVYIANSIIGKENDDKIKDIDSFVNPDNVKVFDEHHYQPVEWACDGHYRFDGYPRGKFDLFIGELGIDGKYPVNLLASGTVRMSLERNGD
ncbi:MAG: alpha-L-arabinofuranosidase, partial [Candidatus Cryptobacteroides sp.]